MASSTDAHNASTNSGFYDAIIFDLGGVLFTWSSSPESPLSAKVVGRILSSSLWYEYEKGNLDEAKIYSLIANQFAVEPADVKKTFQIMSSSLQSNKKVLEVIRELKGTGRSIYAMSNISAPDWEMLKNKATQAEWALFDHTFTSASARQRKPNVGFFKYVIEKSGIDPSRTIFVDDKLENVLTARSFGMHGILFDDESKVIRDLKNLCYDPVPRGEHFLTSRKKALTSVTSNNTEFMELLILLATGDESLVDFTMVSPGLFNFFQGRGLLTTEVFANDLDTTSVGLTVSSHVDAETKHRIMDEMLHYRDSDGIIQVYFDHYRPRMDPIVCVNVLDLFYQNGRGHELSETLDWVEQVLKNRAYISGSYYYVSADHFLFFLSRLLQDSVELRGRLEPIFRERVMERFGTEGDSLSLALRIIAATVVDLVDERDFKSLLSMQCEDGSWSDSWFWKYGASPILIQNDGVTTAFAIRSIEQVQSLRKRQSNTSTALPPLRSKI
ncbi:hypothetical protein C0992_005067 [Termitomyces sp. T32_za158]|nr:hypothetical protein C0992_005067 [Termitomyces sp. T32_za158]